MPPASDQESATEAESAALVRNHVPTDNGAADGRAPSSGIEPTNVNREKWSFCSFDFSVFLLVLAGGALALLGIAFANLAVEGLSDLFGRGATGACSDSHSCGPVLRVVVAWLCLYFALTIVFGSALYEYAIGEKHGSHSATEIGDRVRREMLEQSLPFLCVLALHATLLDSGSAAQLGWAWLLVRAVYPVLYPYALEHGQVLLLVSTLPSYVIIAVLAWPLAGLVACDPACGPHGTCMGSTCICDAVYKGKLYSTPWTGSTCEVQPALPVDAKVCCTWWCLSNGEEAASEMCEPGFHCCGMLDCCGDEACAYYSCEHSSLDTCDGAC